LERKKDLNLPFLSRLPLKSDDFSAEWIDGNELLCFSYWPHPGSVKSFDNLQALELPKMIF